MFYFQRNPNFYRCFIVANLLQHLNSSLVAQQQSQQNIQFQSQQHTAQQNFQLPQTNLHLSNQQQIQFMALSTNSNANKPVGSPIQSQLNR